MKTLVRSIIVVLTLVGQSMVYGQISMGNGQNNWIIVDDVTREGGKLTFSEVQIEGNGFLIIHPFENGAPNGDRVVASTALKAGKNENVEINVHRGLDAGEMFIVMLHSDSNDNGVLDFIFIDDRNVMDLAVFEEDTLIGHAIPAP